VRALSPLSRNDANVDAMLKHVIDTALAPLIKQLVNSSGFRRMATVLRCEEIFGNAGDTIYHLGNITWSQGDGSDCAGLPLHIRQYNVVIRIDTSGNVAGSTVGWSTQVDSLGWVAQSGSTASLAFGIVVTLADAGGSPNFKAGETYSLYTIVQQMQTISVPVVAANSVTVTFDTPIAGYAKTAPRPTPTDGGGAVASCFVGADVNNGDGSSTATIAFGGSFTGRVDFIVYPA
jgi:hypothetical protein